MARDLLSDTAIRKIKPGDHRKRLNDGDGLYLLLFVKGGSHGWRFDYSIHGRRKTLSLGTYPDTTLALARRKADEARRQVAEGIDPSDLRKAAKEAHAKAKAVEEREAQGLPPEGSFEAVAREWITMVHARKVSEAHADRTLKRLESFVFPWLGRDPLASIKPPALLQCLRRVEEKGAVETAHRVKQACGQVFRYGIQTGHCERDPSADLRDALAPVVVKHHAAILEPARVGELLRAIDSYRGYPVTRAALQLAPLVFVRPGELRKAAWSEFDLDAGTWLIPSERMKRTKQEKLSGAPHLVPLCRQAVEILRGLQPLTGNRHHVFPGLVSPLKPMSDNGAAPHGLPQRRDERARIQGHCPHAAGRTPGRA